MNWTKVETPSLLCCVTNYYLTMLCLSLQAFMLFYKPIRTCVTLFWILLLSDVHDLLARHLILHKNCIIQLLTFGGTLVSHNILSHPGF